MPDFWTEKVTAQGACMEEMHAVQDVARDPKIPLLSGYLVIFPNRMRSAVPGPLRPASPGAGGMGQRACVRPASVLPAVCGLAVGMWRAGCGLPCSWCAGGWLDLS
ncbi:hypothetical protein A0U91_04625 [Acetobacter persici]|uniref:Uncharacterized protein n=1 Tax=Acetobacter persici TaxID=1076596 RepID=A0A1U9LD45_9PROT|nr:hypothetical protein A0U91_04625 [Acetobacter persici]